MDSDRSRRVAAEAARNTKQFYQPSNGVLIFGGVVGPDPRKRVRGNGTWILSGNSWIEK